MERVSCPSSADLLRAEVRPCSIRGGRQRRAGKAIRRDRRTQRRGSEPLDLRITVRKCVYRALVLSSYRLPPDCL